MGTTVDRVERVASTDADPRAIRGPARTGWRAGVRARAARRRPARPAVVGAPHPGGSGPDPGRARGLLHCRRGRRDLRELPGVVRGLRRTRAQSRTGIPADAPERGAGAGGSRRDRRRPDRCGVGRPVRRGAGRRLRVRRAVRAVGPRVDDFHAPRIEALLEAGPDLLAIETIPSILEAEALVTILEGLPGVSAWISFSCSDGVRICDGTSFADAAALAASSSHVVAVGVNCSPPVHIPALLSSVRVDTPLLAYPNVGSTWDAVTKSWILEGPRPDFGAAAMEWRTAGARIVGGCCGTTPDDIRAIAARR
jgi:hypothetical protein